MAIAKQKAKASKSNSTATPPAGMTLIAGGFANSWDVEKMPVLEGQVSSPPHVVALTQGGKKVDRKCVEVKTENGDRYTLWESAALVNFFEALSEKVPCSIWVSFMGYGKAKQGQNAPKLFEAAIGE